MPRRRPDGSLPNWSRLCKLAAPQVGYFTGAQAQLAGYSPQLLQYYIQKALIERTHRGVFHLTRFPRGEQEELIVLWLWSEGLGVFSHETALALHGLIGELPEKFTLTMPTEWRRRRRRVPQQATIHYADLPHEDQVVLDQGPLLITTPLRTLLDCHLARIDPALLDRAQRTALRCKLVTRSALQRALYPPSGRKKVATGA